MSLWICMCSCPIVSTPSPIFFVVTHHFWISPSSLLRWTLCFWERELQWLYLYKAIHYCIIHFLLLEKSSFIQHCQSQPLVVKHPDITSLLSLGSMTQGHDVINMVLQSSSGGLPRTMAFRSKYVDIWKLGRWLRWHGRSERERWGHLVTKLDTNLIHYSCG